MSFLVKKYINLIAYKLERFSWQKENLSVCRCPICGDSQKNKSKTRFYIFTGENAVWFVKCHNCGYTNSFVNFLKDFDSNVFRDYQFELFQDKITPSSTHSSAITEKPQPPPINSYMLPKCWCVADLDDNHPVVKYCTRRGLRKPTTEKLFYTENFQEFAKSLVSDTDDIPADGRLVLPFYDLQNRLTYVQGRSIDPQCDLRYSSISLHQKNHIFGLADADLSKPVMVVEGPIDSLFLSNSVALAGSSNSALYDLPWEKSKIVMVYDNEPRGKDICKLIRKSIVNGYRVCIWPKCVTQKDVNDMVLAGLDPEKLINDNTVEGIEAMLRFNDWQKVNV